MGLDASAKFFYGMSLSHTISELWRRDEDDGKRKCLKCGQLYRERTKFCPEDGESTEPIKPALGWGALSEGYPEPVKGAEGLKAMSLDFEDKDTYVLIVADSLQEAGNLRNSHVGNPLGLGKLIISNVAWDNQLRRVCQTFGIKYVEPQWYLGLYLSY